MPTVETTEAVAPAKPAGGLKGFFATTTGKIVVIGLAVTALLAVIGVVAFIVLGAMLFGGGETDVTTTPVTSTPATGTAATGAPEAPAPVAVVENRDVFTPRNPFTPLVLPASAFPNAVTTGSTVTSGSVEANTLVLNDIITNNGVLSAVLQLGGTSYTLGAGQQLGTSPWRVLSVGSTSVTMLYGDEQIVLSVGQGITTK